MWALGRRAVAGLPPRTASRASVSVGIPRGSEPIGACGHRGLQVTISSASAIRHSVSTRAALHSAGRARPYAEGALCAHAPGRTGRTRAAFARTSVLAWEDGYNDEWVCAVWPWSVPL